MNRFKFDDEYEERQLHMEILGQAGVNESFTVTVLLVCISEQ